MKTPLGVLRVKVVIAVILAGVATLLVIVALAGNTRDANFEPGVVAAHQQFADVVGKLSAEHQQEMRKIEIEYVSNVFGEDAGNLFYRCTTEPPPANPSNQRRCQNLLRRIQAAHDADAAADIRKKANW
jgi:hypothetical protein